MIFFATYTTHFYIHQEKKIAKILFFLTFYLTNTIYSVRMADIRNRTLNNGLFRKLGGKNERH